MHVKYGFFLYIRKFLAFKIICKVQLKGAEGFKKSFCIDVDRTFHIFTFSKIIQLNLLKRPFSIFLKYPWIIYPWRIFVYKNKEKIVKTSKNAGAVNWKLKIITKKVFPFYFFFPFKISIQFSSSVDYLYKN